MLATYSREGPPYFELIEAIGESVWAPAMAGRGLHHFGVLAADPLAEIARLEACGFEVEVQAVSPEGVVTGPTYLLNRYGVRVEGKRRGRARHGAGLGRVGSGRRGRTATHRTDRGSYDEYTGTRTP